MAGLKPKFAAAIAVAAIGVASFALAQNQPGYQAQPGQPTAQPGQFQPAQPQPGQLQPGTTAQQPGQRSDRTDSQLAACLIIDNQNEIAVSQIVQQKAQTDEIKRFAQQMIDDHQKFVSKLQPFVQPQEARFIQSQGAAGRQQDAAARPNEGVRQTSAVSPAQGETGTEGGLNPLQLKQELAQQCLESARRELDQKRGAEVDKCFAFMQVGGHMMMVDHLTVFHKHASPDLKKTLAEGKQTAQQHLENAKQLAQSLEGTQGVARPITGSQR